jgi:hypothetical protein
MARYDGQVEPRFSALHKDKDLWWVVPFRVHYMIGICGLRYSGKSHAVMHLIEKKGLALYMLSTTLRRMAAAQGISPGDRHALQDFGDQLRRERGDDVLAVETLREIRRDVLSHRADGTSRGRIAIGGFKRPEEVEAFRKIEQFEPFSIVVSEDAQRYERANAAGIPAYELRRPLGEAVPDEDIYELLDKRDRFGLDGDRHSQAVDAVVEGVPESNRIDNDGPLPQLYRQLDVHLAELDKRYRRPRD